MKSVCVTIMDVTSSRLDCGVRSAAAPRLVPEPTESPTLLPFIVSCK